jgi:hypothetical protein
MEIAIKWEVFKELDVPCSSISYQRISERGARLIITMHFSRVFGGCNKDLELTFSDLLALQWEDESYGIIELPDDLPTCSKDGFTNWTYPTLIIRDSNWANLYAARTHTEAEYENHQVKHFAFISMNDLLHVLSKKEPSVKLVEVKNGQ